jgi:hypothetical protein
MRSLNLLKRLPRAGLLAGRQMGIVDNVSRVSLPAGVSQMAGAAGTSAAQASAREASRLANRHRTFVAEHGMSPTNWFTSMARPGYVPDRSHARISAQAGSLLNRQRLFAEQASNLRTPTSSQIGFATAPGTTQQAQKAIRATRQAQQYFRDYGETPGDTLEKGIGVANGVLNLGIGAGIGAAPHLMPSMPGTAMNKQSAANVTPELIRQEANRQLQLDTAKKILGMTGVGFGAGFGLRSLVGLSSLMKRNLSGPPKPSLMSSAAIPIPVQDPYVEGGERKEKKANDVFSNLGNYFSELLKGRKATTPTGIPWAVPAAMAAAPVGMYAGARAADFIADKLRASELDAELKSEQEQFEAALRGQQGTKLAAALDELEAELEKKGSFDNALGAMLGLYAGYAGLSGLSAGSAVYDATKKTQTAHVLQEALKQREAANNAKRPVPIMLADPGDQEEQLA